jgi:hypothetical protein
MEMKMKHLICSAALALGIVTCGLAAAQASASANSQKIFKGYALTELGAAGLLYNTKAKAGYLEALGPLRKEPWLARLDGPSSENKAVKAAGADYVQIATCKNHDCADHRVLLLWSAPDVVYGKVVQRGKSTLIGSPSPAMAGELDRLWKQQWGDK